MGHLCVLLRCADVGLGCVPCGPSGQPPHHQSSQRLSSAQNPIWYGMRAPVLQTPATLAVVLAFCSVSLRSTNAGVTWRRAPSTTDVRTEVTFDERTELTRAQLKNKPSRNHHRANKRQPSVCLRDGKLNSSSWLLACLRAPP